MIKTVTLAFTLLLMACNASHEQAFPDESILGQAVMGEIAPDTVFRGSFIAQSGGICGLVLIEADRFADDASIRFNTSFDPSGFEASDGIRSDCLVGQVTIIDLVTGQGHTISAPPSLDVAQTFTRQHIERLTL